MSPSTLLDEPASNVAPSIQTYGAAAPTTQTSSTPEPTLGTLVVPGADPLEMTLVSAAAEILGDAATHDLGTFRLPVDFKLSILMPVYNERRTIDEILQRVLQLPLTKEVIVVDDGSTDGTREWLAAQRKSPEVRIVFHERNRGKGAALRTALTHASGDVVVIQDADLEYDPNEFLKLVRPIVEDRADVVYGSRFLAGKPRQQTWYHWLANRLLTTASNLFTDLNLTDMETCQKVFHRRALSGVRIMEDRFGVEPELTAKIARRGCRVLEMPIEYAGRPKDEGKKIGLKDAFRALWCIVKYSM